MNIRQATGIYFSPTGHSKKAVLAILSQFCVYREELDLTAARRRPDYCFCEDELAIVGSPVYSGRLPELAVKRFRRLKGHNTPALILVTYGSRAFEDALVELEDVMQEQGFLPMAAAAVVAGHNIVPKIAEGRPDKADLDKLKQFSARCADAIRNLPGASRIRVPSLPGSRPYLPFKPVSVKIKVSGTCSNCGICVRECPVQAISRTDPRVMDEERCISCMRCIEVCPRGGRRLSSLFSIAAGMKLKQVCNPEKKPEFFFSEI